MCSKGDGMAKLNKSEMKKYGGSPYTIGWCGEKLFDAQQLCEDCLMSNYTASNHSYFDRILRDNYGIDGRTLIDMLGTLVRACRDFERDFDNSVFNASTKKSKKIQKAPIVNLYGMDDEETRGEIDFYNSGADVTAEEIEALAPSADVIVNMGAIDVVWNLPSGNHPGLWITTHGKGRQGVHLTATHFDYPDEEGVSGFLNEMESKYGHPSYELVNSGSGLPAEDIKNAVREMEQMLGRYAVESKMPRYNGSAKKSMSNMSFEANVNSLRKSNYAKTGNLNSVMKKR
jgi:hypothetical protein